MRRMFGGCWEFNQPLNNWDVSNVINMQEMFQGCWKFNQPLDNWNVSNVTDMSFMFLHAIRFNQNINNWEVGNVKNMRGLFDCAHKFNKPLNNWDVSNVNDMSEMFSSEKDTNLKFNQPLDNWDVSNVTNMNNMFYNATEFNQPLNNWDVSSVTDMRNMFYNAKSFNQSIDSWDLSKVNLLQNMFKGASSFKHKLPNDMIKILGNFIEEKEKELIIKKTPINTKDFLVKKTQIKINNQFSLKNSDNNFKLIDYTWNGGDDFNYNIFNKEPLPEGEYIGSPSSSELTISVNDTTLYIKHYNIQDGPIPEDFYLGISQSPNYDNIEWFKRISRDNPELIDIIFILCMGLRDEDFVYEHGEFDYYEEPGHKYEVNIEIDINALKDMWDEF